MRSVAVALVLMVVAWCFCVASARWSIEGSKMHGKNKQVGSQNDHHSIPLKDYGKGNPDSGPGHHDVTDDNDHHYIPRKDFGKPGSAQFHVTNDDGRHCIANNKADRCYGSPGDLTKTYPPNPKH